MQKLLTCILNGFLLLMSTAVIADDPPASDPANSAGQQQADELEKLTTYLQNLGQYFGYDITSYCTSGGSCASTGSASNGASSSPSNTSFSNNLLSANDTLTLQLNLYNSYLGSLLGGGAQNSLNFTPIVPESMASFSYLNNLAGSTFITPPYSSPSQTISVSDLIDQQNSQKQYQSEPVSQAILNILATPNYTYCYDSTSTKLNLSCTYLTKERVMANIIGELPPTFSAFTADYNQPLIGQLNSEALISPLIYSTTPIQSNTNQNTTTGPSSGLTAQSQAQQAMNFIRYVSAAVVPITLPQKKIYDDLYIQATDRTQPIATQAAARVSLTSFLMSLRVYAAQNSISLNNLYYILSRRMPQNLVPVQGGKGGSSSEALNEFTMASWRLFNPANNDGSITSQWLTKINGASNATVQKEIAILLAEINYQLYLTRQQQERLLLTQSVANIQNTLTARPDGSSLIPTNVSSSP